MSYALRDMMLELRLLSERINEPAIPLYRVNIATGLSYFSCSGILRSQFNGEVCRGLPLQELHFPAPFCAAGYPLGVAQNGAGKKGSRGGGVPSGSLPEPLHRISPALLRCSRESTRSGA